MTSVKLKEQDRSAMSAVVWGLSGLSHIFCLQAWSSWHIQLQSVSKAWGNCLALTGTGRSTFHSKEEQSGTW